MPRKTADSLPTKSYLSREDIELLSELKGGMQVLIEQVNSLQTNVRSDREELRRSHDEQMKAITIKVTDLETWRASYVTPSDIQAWNNTARKVDIHLSDEIIETRAELFAWVQTYRGRWAWIVGLVGTIAAVFGYIASTVIPLLRGGG